MKTLYNIILLTAFVSFSCTKNSNHERSQEAAKTSSAGTPEIVFNNKKHDFGDLVEGEKVMYTFTFKNTGTANLILNDVKATCGCTTPEWSKKPVKPNQTGKIEVVFDSSGRSGEQYKTVRVITNAKKQEQLLVITANINTDV